MDMRIRDTLEADLPAIVDIDNQFIPAGLSTANTQPITVAERVKWFRKVDSAIRPKRKGAPTRTRLVPVSSQTVYSRLSSHHRRTDNDRNVQRWLVTWRIVIL